MLLYIYLQFNPRRCILEKKFEFCFLFSAILDERRKHFFTHQLKLKSMQIIHQKVQKLTAHLL